jgi:hypothetical protein
MNYELQNEELLPLNTIRVETVLSRFSVHRISKRGNISIEIKVDTLIVSRRLEEAPRPIPEIIKLGSLKEIDDELGLADSGKNRKDIKRALHQNAGAYISAKRSYKAADGTQRTAEVSDTRYGIIFTGEKFPDGSRADAVYLILHRAYRDILNRVRKRGRKQDPTQLLQTLSQ